jgi:predicted phosphodiesterase
MGKRQQISKLEQELKKQNLDENEAIHFIRQLQKKPRRHNVHEHRYSEGKCKIGILSDTHIGSKYYNPKIMDEAIKQFSDVDAIYHSGDIIEGMSNREGHIYELDVLGTSNQVNLAVDILNQFNKPIYFITGNHDEWSKKKSDQGYEVGPELERRIKDSKFLGEYSADIKLSPGVTMRLTHEGQTAYALSYSLQKRINSMSGGDKPDVLINGHLHKMLYMFYRNIHSFEAGSTQEQTPFAKMKGSPSMCGFWTLDLNWNKTKLIDITPKMFPFY